LGGSMWKSLSTRPTSLVIFQPLLSSSSTTNKHPIQGEFHCTRWPAFACTQYLMDYNLNTIKRIHSKPCTGYVTGKI
jgi:hypothetical protein